MGKNLRDELKKSSKKTVYENLEPADKQKAEEYMKKYGGKSESELMNELFKKVREKKASGTFSTGELDKFADSMKNVLSPEQRQKMQSIIKSLKNDK